METTSVIRAGPRMDCADASFSSALASVARKRVFFGHQSVGQNILDGLRELDGGASAQRLRFVENDFLPTLAEGSWLHCRLGINGDPISKVLHFARLMRQGLADEVDVALFKLCYVDVKANTPLAPLLALLIETFTALSARNPRTSFVAMTVPLTAVQRGPKAWVKRGLHRPVGGALDNVQRHLFNQALRAARLPALFDLAFFESIYPNENSVETFRHAGSSFPALVPTFTDDGGHLNAVARQRVARGLIRFLAERT